MSRQMLNEKTFQNTPHLEPITIPGRPDVAPKVMTLEGTIWRSVFLLVLAIASAAYGWSFGDQITGTVSAIMLIGLLGADRALDRHRVQAADRAVHRAASTPWSWASGPA